MAQLRIQPHRKATFRIFQNSKLFWRVWDDEFIIFHPLSGDTHLLDYFSAEVLKSIEDAPAECAEIAAFISRKFEIDLDEKLVDRIEELLSKFSKLNLIEPVQ
jgi:PqqD family protein of HPr-rel-A system